MSNSRSVTLRVFVAHQDRADQSNSRGFVRGSSSPSLCSSLLPELIPGPLAALQHSRVVCISTRALSELFGGYEAGRADSSWEGRGESHRLNGGRSAQARHAVSITDPARTTKRFGLKDQADHSPILTPSPSGGSVTNSCR